MTQRESRLSRNIMTAVRQQGYFCFKIHGGPTMMAGLPDIIVCAEGLFIGLETKNPESRDNVSPKQHLTHSEIRRRGKGKVAVVCSPGEALEFIQKVIDEDIDDR